MNHNTVYCPVWSQKKSPQLDIICLLFNIIVCIYTRGDSVTIMFVQEVFSDEELLTMHCRIMFVQEVFSDEKLLASKYGGNSKKVLQ